jgi:TonB family protein
MGPNVLDNLARWNLQIVLLTVVAAVVLHLLKVTAPVIRHAFWRMVLLVCLALPLVQPWRSTTIELPPQGMGASVQVPLSGEPMQTSLNFGSSFAATVSGHMRTNWVSYAGLVLACGVVLRLAWLLIGIYRLQKLRRAGALAVTAGGYEELAALIEAGAEIRRVERLGQPVTFGVLKPAVLLPASFSALPVGVQRAVLAHELWHVRRRDWAWVLLEEAIRAAFWFNPAMWWLISRVQSSREEVVDQLTVQLTNAPKTYLEALLAFADEPTLFPATPFARRRHLFHRMLLISREAVMSSRRIVASSVAMATVLLATGLYASSTFPLKSAAPSSVASASQSPPRDRRPGEAGPETARERELKKAIAADPTAVESYLKLAGLQEGRGAPNEAEATLQALTRALPDQPKLLGALAGFYTRTGQFDRAIATLEQAASQSPSDAQAQQMVAVFYWEKVFKDKALSPVEQRTYIDAGIDATDRALSNKPDYSDALVYKNLLLRMKANLEGDAAVRQALVAEANALRDRAIVLKKTTGQDAMVFVPRTDGQAPPPPPPPPPPPDMVDGQAPVRVGGNVRPPTKTRDVKPIYPVEAQEAGVQGVIVMEIMIDQVGNVATARVMRGQPLLDQAALDAVRQWQFAPTQLNNVPVPVIMTVTVNFTMQ